MKEDKANVDKISTYWSKEYGKDKKIREAWWESDFVKTYINRLVAEVDSSIDSDGLNQLLKKQLNGRRLKTGVSVGCGTAHKEMRLIELGIVDKFILFDLSKEALKIGQEKALKLGFQNKVEFHCEDAFLYDFSDIEVDFVHWNNSLHHMFDVPASVKWSYDILMPNGVFYMDDYVGPNRFQYSDNVLQIANKIRESIIGDYSKTIGRITRCDPEKLAQFDPSEAVDSERILESVSVYFPQAHIVLTGGIVYFLTLGGLYFLFNEDNEKHISILKHLMEVDKSYVSTGIPSLYAAALAFK